MGLVDWESFEQCYEVLVATSVNNFMIKYVLETLVVHEVMLHKSKKKEQRNPLLTRVSLINSLKLKYENKVNSALKLD